MRHIICIRVNQRKWKMQHQTPKLLWKFGLEFKPENDIVSHKYSE